MGSTHRRRGFTHWAGEGLGGSGCSGAGGGGGWPTQVSLIMILLSKTSLCAVSGGGQGILRCGRRRLPRARASLSPFVEYGMRRAGGVVPLLALAAGVVLPAAALATARALPSPCHAPLHAAPRPSPSALPASKSRAAAIARRPAAPCRDSASRACRSTLSLYPGGRCTTGALTRRLSATSPLRLFESRRALNVQSKPPSSSLA